MPFEDPQHELEAILDNIARIERFVDGLLTEQQFYNDEKTVYAVRTAMLVISEAARRLGDRAEALCPGQPWADIRGIGNWLRHGYDHIDLGVLWRTIREDLGPLQTAVHAAVNRLDDEGPGLRQP